ncbi:MAG: saccharopine dehydrogenase NADP-binding domain-containing protein [Pseudomonadota bacterium]
MGGKRQYDLILYGATGFTGKLTAAYLDTHPELKGRPWAIAGRNEQALKEVKRQLTSGTVGVVTCALTDPQALREMVSSTQVIITTAGPFSAYDGDKLLAACAEAGVHYSDLSGEGFWQREMIDAHHETAKNSGAKIILGGGVDSIPSDLGTYLALKPLVKGNSGEKRIRVTGKYTEYSGSFSGGTLASGKARQAAIKSGRLSKESLRDPYLLAPDAQGNPDQEPTLDGMPANFKFLRDRVNGVMLPFFMGIINAPVVRRSLSLMELDQYVSYRECCAPIMWARASWLITSRGLGYPLGEPINFKPKSGQGPPVWLQQQGGFAVEVMAEALSTGLSGDLSGVLVTGRGDPGYGATSKMLAELALCVIDDERAKPDSAGVLTPSTALGDALIDQLNEAQNGAFMRIESL